MLLIVRSFRARQPGKVNHDCRKGSFTPGPLQTSGVSVA